MSRHLLLLFGCAVSLFIISIPLYAAESAIPQQVLDWQKAAQNGIVKNDPAVAVVAYQKIQQAYPNTAYAADAQKQVVLTYLQANQSDKAILSLSEFTQKYSLQPGYISQMGEIINRMADAKLASQAKEACQSLLKQFPDNPEMMGVLQRKARCEVMMNEPDMADATVKLMQQKYTTHPQYVYAMNWAAFEYRIAGFYPRAMGLYNYLLTLSLPADIQFRCRAGLALTEMKLGDTAAAVKEVQQVKTAIRGCQNYDQVGELEEVINTLADAGQLGTSRELCQAAFEQFPDNPQILGLLQRKAKYEVMMKEPDLADQTVKVMQQKYASNPGIGSILAQTAYVYCSQEFYPQAMKLYQDVLNSKPAGDIELRCRAGIVLVYLKRNDTENALQAAQQIKAAVLTCQNYDQMAELEEIINPLADAGQAGTSREICQAVAERFPGNPQLLGLLQRKARCEVMMKEANMADATVKIMQEKYVTHPQYANALSWAAYEYSRMGFYPLAMDLYNQILNLKPSEDVLLRCISGLAEINIHQGEDNAAQKTIDLIYSDYQKYPDASSVVFAIGEDYYLQAIDLLKQSKNIQAQQSAIKSRQILEDLLLRIPKTACASDALLCLGYNNIILGDNEKALQSFQTLVKTYPKSDQAPQGYMQLATCLGKTAQGEKSDSLQIQKQIEETYKTVIEQYPQSSVAVEAMYNLGRQYMLQEKYQDGILYYEKIIDKTPQNTLVPTILLELGDIYEKTGNKAKAKENYTLLLGKLSHGVIYEQVKQKLQSM